MQYVFDLVGDLREKTAADLSTASKA